MSAPLPTPLTTRLGAPGTPSTHPGDAGFIGATTHEPADRQRRRRRTPLAWLPWAALAALLALLLLAGLAAYFAGDHGSDSAAATGRSTAGVAASTGSLTADGKDVLASGNLDRIADLNGTSATGRGVLVQSVVADEGFWVGRSTADRVFVYLTPAARRTNGESPFQVRAGEHVDLTGTVGVIGPDGPQHLGVTDTEGARQLTAQNGYILAKTLRLSR